MKTFLEKITSTAMMERFGEICAQRPDVRVIQYILGQPKILEWVHTIGVCDDELLRALVPPLPPLELRSITAAPDLPEFLWTGLVDMERIMTLYENVAGLTNQHPTILDFGCGCGRMVRFLRDYDSLPNSIHGCEVNADHVSWCRDNLHGIQISQCSALPPLPYQEQKFNLVYALSVFTHLSELNAANWLSEMRRVLAPNGILIVTIHGFAALTTIRDSVPHQAMFGLDRQQIVGILENFKENPFVFHKYNQDTLEIAKAGSEYGNAFIHPDYIIEKWEKAGFKVLDLLPGGLRGWQDIVILQRTDPK